jgi:hypothetical protein
VRSSSTATRSAWPTRSASRSATSCCRSCRCSTRTPWGLPFSATMVGASQVYPGVQPTPADIAGLIESERVTITAGVPTVLLGSCRRWRRRRTTCRASARCRAAVLRSPRV